MCPEGVGLYGLEQWKTIHTRINGNYAIESWIPQLQVRSRLGDIFVYVGALAHLGHFIDYSQSSSTQLFSRQLVLKVWTIISCRFWFLLEFLVTCVQRCCVLCFCWEGSKSLMVSSRSRERRITVQEPRKLSRILDFLVFEAQSLAGCGC